MPKKNSGRNSKVSFQKSFYSDMTLPGMYYAITIRSPAGEGIIKAVSHPDLPEGYFLVTARDIPGSNLIDTHGGKVPVFCEGNISYPGEPVGILTGPDEFQLMKLLGELQFSIDMNPIESYLSEADNSAEEFFSNKITERMEMNITPDELEKIIEESPHTSEHSWTYALKAPDYGEPNGAICSWKDDNLTIYTPTLWLNNLRKTAATVLDIKTENINIEKTTSTNRGTNSIWYNSVIACQAAIASKKCGHPVKLVYSRQEQEMFMDTMQPVTIFHKTAADEKGKIIAMKVDISVDAGFSNPFAREIIDRLVIASCGCYNPDKFNITATAFRSHSPSSSFDLQLIDSPAFFAVENQMNLLCKECNLTPTELRLLNSMFVENAGTDGKKLQTKKKKTESLPWTIEVEKYSQTISALAKISDFNRKHAAYLLDASDWKAASGPKEYVSVFSSPMRGIGFACAFEGSGYYGSEVYASEQALEVTMENENSLTIHCPPISQSIHEIWSRTATEILQLPFVNVKINSVFKHGEEPPLPENVYSNISIMTDLLKKCCEAIKKQKNSTEFPFTVKKKITPLQKKMWNAKDFAGKPFHRSSLISAIVEVEINPCTYREEIRKIHVAVSGGKIMNPQAAESTIKLEIQKVLSSLVKDEKLESQKIKISFIQSEENPTQIGELVYNAIPAAYTQAISQALNCSINELPLTTDSIYLKLKEQKEYLKRMKEQEKMEEEKGKNENNPDAEQ